MDTLCRSIPASILCLLVALLGLLVPPRAQASCGSVTCFVVIGSQQQVSPEGLLTVNLFYNYTPQGTLLSGTTGVIPAVDLQNKQLILNHHQEIRTITQLGTLDLNYGFTDRFGLEIAIPYKYIQHRHIDGLGVDNDGAGQATRFTDSGIGDIFVNFKYNWLPSLRSMVVTGFGIYLPTGSNKAADPGGSGIMEPTVQLGRGQFGLQPSFYQTYEIIPHRLNQFLSGSYRHTFRNNQGYQFGDQYDLGAGVNLVTMPWLTLTTQVNYRYMVHDSCLCSLARSPTPSDPEFGQDVVVLDPTIKNRAIPTTGSTFLAVTPGFSIAPGTLIEKEWAKTIQIYFFSQIPVARDFNGNLAQGVSYLFGVTKYFQVPSFEKKGS